MLKNLNLVIQCFVESRFNNNIYYFYFSRYSNIDLVYKYNIRRYFMKKLVLIFLAFLIFASALPFNAFASGDIYLDGANGNDTNDGTQSSPVKTFEKAKQLATDNQSIQNIFVIGEVSVSGDISLAGTNAKLVRGEGYKGNLLNVMNTTATFSNIIIDGGGVLQEKLYSLIYIGDSTVNINDGTFIQNNKCAPIYDWEYQGGGIQCRRSTVNINGGTIQNNQSTHGGGIYASGCTLNINGGVIQNNKAMRAYNHNNNVFMAAGGGVLLLENTTCTMSGNTLVKGNYSEEVGGGISVCNTQWSEPCTFIMNGGTIEANSSEGTGAGVFVNANLRMPHRAYINQGKIINNHMLGGPNRTNTFGGGGIYVNGIKLGFAGVDGWVYGEVYIKNALIINNSSKYYGGGIAACPISKTKLYVKNGVALYGNKAKMGGNDIFIYCNTNMASFHGGNPEYDISERMLGGQPFNWRDNDGNLYPLSELKGVITDNNTAKVFNTNEVLSDEAKGLAKVIISGNISETSGGGIGSNGTVVFGTEEPKKDILVRKVWDTGVEPEPIDIYLRAKIGDVDWLIEKVHLDKSNGFQQLVKNLPEKIHDKNISDIIYLKEDNNKYIFNFTPAQPKDKTYNLSFDLQRNEINEFEFTTKQGEKKIIPESIHAVYQHYIQENKDFEVKYHLGLLQGEDQTILDTQVMSYKIETYSWQGKISFSNIPIDSATVKVDYYDTGEDDKWYGSYFYPAQDEYYLWLNKNDDNSYTLYIPKVFPYSMYDYKEYINDNVHRILKLSNLAVKNNGNDCFEIVGKNSIPTPVPSTPTPSPEPPTLVPKTGDSFNSQVVIIAIMAVVCSALVIILRKKRNIH